MYCTSLAGRARRSARRSRAGGRAAAPAPRAARAARARDASSQRSAPRAAASERAAAAVGRDVPARVLGPPDRQAGLDDHGAGAVGSCASRDDGARRAQRIRRRPESARPRARRSRRRGVCSASPAAMFATGAARRSRGACSKRDVARRPATRARGAAPSACVALVAGVARIAPTPPARRRGAAASSSRSRIDARRDRLDDPLDRRPRRGRGRRQARRTPASSARTAASRDAVPSR